MPAKSMTISAPEMDFSEIEKPPQAAPALGLLELYRGEWGRV